MAWYRSRVFADGAPPADASVLEYQQQHSLAAEHEYQAGCYAGSKGHFLPWQGGEGGLAPSSPCCAFFVVIIAAQG
jgi:hypothetical protein